MCAETSFVYAGGCRGNVYVRRRRRRLLCIARYRSYLPARGECVVAPRGLIVRSGGDGAGAHEHARGGFRPGTGGLFCSLGATRTPHTAGGPCDIFGVNGNEFPGGAGHGSVRGGHMFNPNSFSFFSSAVEYGQRRTRAEQKSVVPTAVLSSQNVPLPAFSESSHSDPHHGLPGSPSLQQQSHVNADGSGDEVHNGQASYSAGPHETGDRCQSVPSSTSTSARPGVSNSQFADALNVNQHLSDSACDSGATSIPATSGDASCLSPGSTTSATSAVTPSPPHKRWSLNSSNSARFDTVDDCGDTPVDLSGSELVSATTSGNISAATPSHSGARVSSKIRRQVRARFEQARNEEKSGNFDEARGLLCECLNLDRRDAHSWLALARLEARRGGVSLRSTSNTNFPSPLQQTNSSASPMSPDSRISLNSAAVSLESPMSKHKTKSTSNSDIRKFDVRSLLSQPLSEKAPSGTVLARALFEEGLRECPNSVHLLQAWAVLEHRCGDPGAARKLFARGLSLEPDNPYVCQAWGLMEQRCGDTEAARDLFRRVVELRPHPEVCSAWAILEAREGHIARARELFKCGLQSCPNLQCAPAATLYRTWSEIEERVGDLVSARDLLSKAISSHPRVAEPYVALARLEARRGNKKRADELMATAFGLSRKPPAFVFNAGAQIEWGSGGNINNARDILERGHELHPSDPALLQSLGFLEGRCGNVLRAKELYAKSVRARPSAPAFVAWALLEEAEGNYDDCVSLFEQALMTDPLHGAAYNAYGMMEARRDRLDEARAIYERGLKGNGSASVWHGYGQLELKRARNPDRARELFKSGVSQSREDTSFIWHSWGMLELSLRNVKEARAVFLDALKRYPKNSRVLVGAALAHATAGPGTKPQIDVARKYFQRSVAADPTHAHAWQTWGVFELRNGQSDSAEALLKRGLRLCPTHGALWQALGVLETNNGNFIRARQLFQKGIDSCPSHVHLFQAWACMEVRAGNIDRARSLLDAALRSDPGHGPVWNAYGLLEARHGSLEKARQNFITGIERAPNHSPLYRTYGQTEARAGNYTKARRILEEGLRRDPHHAPLYHAFAEFEGMIGNVDGLAKLRERAEKYFGSAADASRVIRSGEEILQVDVGDSSDEYVEYVSKATPMELALDLRWSM